MSIRDKFRATPVSAFKKKVDEENEQLSSGKNEYLQCEDGKTVKIRFLPAHPGSEDFYVRRKMHWVTVENDEGEKSRRTVPNSIQHGGTKKDIIEEYMAFAATTLNPKDEDDLEKLEAIKGDYPRKDGLKGSNTWVAYALKIEGTKREFGLFEFKKQVRDAINKETLIEDASDPIEVDPFTDPDTGKAILIKYLSKPNKKKGEDYYHTTLAQKPTPVTDEELERLEKATPLKELYGKYTLKDFDRALNGLQNFDTEHEIGLFENEDWLKIVEEVKAQYDEVAEDDDDAKPAKGKGGKKEVSKPAAKPAAKGKAVVEEEDDEEDDNKADEFDSMDRNELKQYIADKELEIVVKKSMSDDDVRAAIRAASPVEEEQAEETAESSDVDFDAMDRNELKQYIADNELEIVVKKSMSDDDVRDAIRALSNTEEQTEETAEQTEESNEVDFDAMDRNELKQYIADNELSVKVVKSMDDDAIREAIKEALSPAEETTEEEPEEEEKPAAKPAGKKLSADEIRAKLKKK